MGVVEWQKMLANRAVHGVDRHLILQTLYPSFIDRGWVLFSLRLSTRHDVKVELEIGLDGNSNTKGLKEVEMIAGEPSNLCHRFDQHL